MNIILEGDCTVQRSAEILQQLRRALIEAQDVLTLSFARVEDADLSFFQLLEATRRSCEAAGKKLVLQADFPQRLGAYARRTGFDELLGAIGNAHSTSLQEKAS